MQKSLPTLRERLAAIVVAMGYEFVGHEQFRQGKYSLLRIYIDNEAGITVDDCAAVSHQISAVLDVDDPIQGEYTLEVSSPGIDRPLFELAHYQKYLGRKVKIKLHTPVGSRRNFLGILHQVQDTNVSIDVDGEVITFPFSNIEKANLSASDV